MVGVQLVDMPTTTTTVRLNSGHDEEQTTQPNTKRLNKKQCLMLCLFCGSDGAPSITQRKYVLYEGEIGSELMKLMTKG